MIYRTKEINNLQFVTWIYNWLKVLYLYLTETNDKKERIIFECDDNAVH